ncbi:MAG: PhzF family phenazine biosynthesis protein [Euryarchaeota archaeon]|nr:PhzF family phenazine biosynthesis protein [Euryarchaeota archaeon]
MRFLPFYKVSAFSDVPYAGNPAAVVLNAEGLDDRAMLTIARDANLTETCFLSSSWRADFKARYFTPTREVELCGHATIAGVHVLVEEGMAEGRRLTLETRVGVLDVEVERRSGGFAVWLTQAEPEFSPGVERGEAASILGVDRAELGHLPVEVASTGLPALLVHLSHRKSLGKIRPKLEEISEVCSRVGAAGVYAFALSDSEAEARFFAPLCGIDEDPVTGTAAGALLAYLLRHGVFSGGRLVVRQGRFLGREGTVYAEPCGSRVRVGGLASTFLRGQILVP